MIYELQNVNCNAWNISNGFMIKFNIGNSIILESISYILLS